jgi:hypothetical protein
MSDEWLVSAIRHSYCFGAKRSSAQPIVKSYRIMYFFHIMTKDSISTEYSCEFVEYLN